MEIKKCPKCGKELFIVSDSKSTKGNTIITQLRCKEHGLIDLVGIPFEEARLSYKILK